MKSVAFYLFEKNIKKLLPIFIILIAAFTTQAQTPEVFLGWKRSHVQSFLNQGKVIKYEKNKLVLMLADSVYFNALFDDREYCTSHYLLTYKSKEPMVRDMYKTAGWEKTGEHTYSRENYKVKIQSLENSNHVIFNVEKLEMPVTGKKPQPAAKPETSSTQVNKNSMKQEEGETFHGLKIFGWEVWELKE